MCCYCGLCEKNHQAEYKELDKFVILHKIEKVFFVRLAEGIRYINRFLTGRPEILDAEGR
jgi:hypothetical protein